MSTGLSQKTLRAYVVGFVSCLILTLAAFYLVIYQPTLDHKTIYLALSLLAVLQLGVQCLCFLGLNFSKEGQWGMLPFLLIILIVAFLVGGSLWIMYNLDYNMMH